ncbi:O-antigen ligase domain-containing protein [Prevotella multiformis]|uniref:O-antigen ligase domain-containing protein n=1 Tax=Prevotella multiformis TaxID=282402 RepID=UPI0028DBEC3A|nr:O-antigen ligase domain-containing protein [Prevotella multiformis]
MILAIKLFVVLVILVFLYFCQKSLVQAYAFFLSVKMVLPTTTRIGSISIYSFMLLVLMFFVFLRNKQCDFSRSNVKFALFPIFTLILPLSFIGLFGSVDYVFQCKELFKFTLTEIAPYILFIIIVNSQEKLQICLRFFVFSFIIIGIYGIVTYIIRLNPLVQAFALTFNYSKEMFIGNGEESIRGAFTSSTTGNQSEGAIPWGQICLVLTCFGFFFKGLSNTFWKKAYVILAILNCFMSTKRSAIFPLMGVIAYYLVERNLFVKRNIIRSLVVLGISVIVVNSTPTLKEYYHANIEPSIFFWDDNLAEKNEITGSNRELRFSQAKYVNNLISNNELFGLGYGYTTKHIEKYGGNTDALFFESLYLWAIANSGYIGLMVWIFFFYSWSRKMIVDNNKHVDIYVFNGAYILSIFLTNIYCSFAYYMITSAFILKNQQMNKLK